MPHGSAFSLSLLFILPSSSSISRYIFVALHQSPSRILSLDCVTPRAPTMAYNKSYNPDALPAHAEPEQVAQMLGNMSVSGQSHAPSHAPSHTQSLNQKPLPTRPPPQITHSSGVPPRVPVSSAPPQHAYAAAPPRLEPHQPHAHSHSHSYSGRSSSANVPPPSQPLGQSQSQSRPHPLHPSPPPQNY
ncbi:hypothetical protein VN97_g5650, partial [Penicillium thymicola]